MVETWWVTVSVGTRSVRTESHGNRTISWAAKTSWDLRRDSLVTCIGSRASLLGYGLASWDLQADFLCNLHWWQGFMPRCIGSKILTITVDVSKALTIPGPRGFPSRISKHRPRVGFVNCIGGRASFHYIDTSVTC